MAVTGTLGDGMPQHKGQRQRAAKYRGKEKDGLVLVLPRLSVGHSQVHSLYSKIPFIVRSLNVYNSKKITLIGI